MPINDGLRHARLALAAGDVWRRQSAVRSRRSGDREGRALAAPRRSAHVTSHPGAPLRERSRSSPTRGRRSPRRSSQRVASSSETPSSSRRRSETRARSIGRARHARRFAVSKEQRPRSTRARSRSSRTTRSSRRSSTRSRPSPGEDPRRGERPEGRVRRRARGDRTRRAASQARKSAGSRTLGRLLAANAPNLARDERVEAIPEPRPASAGGVAIETAVRGKRWAELTKHSRACRPETTPQATQPTSRPRSWPSARAIASARRSLGRGGAWRSTERRNRAHRRRPRSRSRSRAELSRIATTCPTGRLCRASLRGARTEHPLDDEQATLLERVHRAAPTLGIGGSSPSGSVADGAISTRCSLIQERRGYANRSARDGRSTPSARPSSSPTEIRAREHAPGGGTQRTSR